MEDLEEQDKFEEEKEDKFDEEKIAKFDTLASSRESLRSNGSAGSSLQRWSTEEDLSTQDTRNKISTSASKCSSQDSGIHSVGGDSSTDAEHIEIQAPLPIVHRYFGGKEHTEYKCSHCGTKSNHTNVFRELHLAFPQVETTGGIGVSSKTCIKLEGYFKII